MLGGPPAIFETDLKYQTLLFSQLSQTLHTHCDTHARCGHRTTLHSRQRGPASHHESPLLPSSIAHRATPPPFPHAPSILLSVKHRFVMVFRFKVSPFLFTQLIEPRQEYRALQPRSARLTQSALPSIRQAVVCTTTGPLLPQGCLWWPYPSILIE